MDLSAGTAVFAGGSLGMDTGNTCVVYNQLLWIHVMT